MDKEKARQEVEVIVKKFLAIPKNEQDSMPEEDIKFHFIEPLFEALGWMREDISKEKRILKGRADYILRIGNQDKLVIEAKKTNVNLSEEEGRQAVSYAHHKNIKFSVLTNFKKIRVYHALSNIKDIDKNLLKDDKGYFWLDCEDFVEQFDRLWLLSRESFENEEINKLLKNVDKRLIKPIDESILTDLLQYREWLSKDLKSKRMHLEDSQIDEVVQILIDRLIFMRSVEDRGLEAKDFLLKIISDVEKGLTDMNLWAVLKAQFNRFDNTYNSKLFSEGLLEKEGFFDNKSLAKVVRGLYYGTQDNQERYMFDEIPVDLLGSIYEQYLGIVLRGTEKRVKLDLVSGKRKKMGIYYTPSYIVDYIVKNTVRKYTENKTIDEILETKIVDPACGSGSFLIRAFQELINIVEEKLEKGEKSAKWKNTFQQWNEKLSLGEKATLLTNCIYGVDLDEKAVELAQLNLLLKLLEEETRETKKRILPTMRDNIKNGNSLISDSRFDKAFNWNAQFPEVFKDGGFDIVIGNPPYVFAREKMNLEEKKFYLENFNTAKYQLNTYLLFMEKSMSLLKSQGYLGFIIPDAWLKVESASSLRKFLLENSFFDRLIHLRGETFSGVGVESSILILENSNRKGKTKVCKDINQISYEDFSQEEWLQNNNFEIELFSGGEYKALLDKMEKDSKKLNEVTIIRAGLQAYEKGKGNPKQTASDVKKRPYDFNLKKDNTTFEYLEGKDLGRYFNSWRGLWLKYGKWLAAPRTFELFSLPRILVREIPSKPPKAIVATYLEETFLNNRSIINVLEKQGEIKLKYILGILNSRIITFFHLHKSVKAQRDLFPKITLNDLRKFPIKLSTSKSQEQKIISLVEQMLELQKKIHREKVSGNEKEQLEQQIKNVDYEIDEEIYKLYDITDKEREIIEKSLE